MDAVTRDELDALMQWRRMPSVSIYMGTRERGLETRQNAIRFKNQLRKAQSKLEELGTEKGHGAALFDPARPLLEDGLFWQHQSRGLAVFVSHDFFRTYRVALDFEDLVTATYRFHVKPLLPLLTEDSRFYVLAVSQNSARLFHCTKQDSEQVRPEGMPNSLAEALRYDDPQRQVQFHTGSQPATGKRPAMYHGQGVGIDENKDNILRYFRQIDRTLKESVRADKAPFVLAGVDYLFPLYKQANSFATILEKGIAGNPDALTIEELHPQAWALVEAHLAQERRKALEKYTEAAGKGLTLRALEPALRAARGGRVDTLFVARGVQRWGRFDTLTHVVDVHEQEQPGDEDLLDLTALETVLHGGTVHAVEHGEVPDGSLLACALRY